jgi:hypothetical protein
MNKKVTHEIHGSYLYCFHSKTGATGAGPDLGWYFDQLDIPHKFLFLQTTSKKSVQMSHPDGPACRQSGIGIKYAAKNDAVNRFSGTSKLKKQGRKT